MKSIRDVMAHEIISLTPDKTVFEAVLKLADHNIGALAVKDSSGALIGIFSERDLLKRVVAKQIDPKVSKVKDVMSSPVKTILDTASLSIAMRDMSDNNIRHLPVVDSKGSLIGMLGIRDVMRAMMQELIDNFMKS